MKKIKSLFYYFSKGELVLWIGSVFVIVISFCVLDRCNYLTLLASLIGVTSLIFNAKANPFGQFLMIILAYFTESYRSLFPITEK